MGHRIDYPQQRPSPIIIGASVFLLLIVGYACYVSMKGPHVNLKTVREAEDMLIPHEREFVSWEELEIVLGPSAEISLAEYERITGYDLSDGVDYQCRHWEDTDGSWFVYAVDKGRQLSSFKYRVRTD